MVRLMLLIYTCKKSFHLQSSPRALSTHSNVTLRYYFLRTQMKGGEMPGSQIFME